MTSLTFVLLLWMVFRMHSTLLQIIKLYNDIINYNDEVIVGSQMILCAECSQFSQVSIVVALIIVVDISTVVPVVPGPGW